MSSIDILLLYIEEHLSNEVCVSDIVRVSGCSRRTVHSMFIERVGISPGAYIRRRKLCNAAVWLRLTSMSGTAIAFRLGFSSHQSFSREFTRFFGVSPRVYRNRDTWDMSLLMPPAPMVRENSLDLACSRLVSLPEMLLSGSKMSFIGKLPCQGRTRDSQWMKLIFDNLNRCEHDLFIVSETRIIPGGVDNFLVNTLFGRVVDFDDVCGRVESISGGLYLKYSFSGTPVEYSTLSIDIATGLLPVLGLKRRRGADIECFKYSGGEVSDTGVVCCDYYMPVSH